MSEDKRTWSLFPKTLSACIEPAVRPVMKTQGLAGSRIINEWPSVVGETLAAHCIPQQLSFPPGKKSGGTLSVAVENGFATELQHLQPLIIERLATYFGYKAVVRVTISHTYVPEAAPPAPKARAATLSAEHTDLSTHVQDPELRAALEAMAKTLSGGN